LTFVNKCLIVDRRRPKRNADVFEQAKKRTRSPGGTYTTPAAAAATRGKAESDA
jgi:hypothetical protein